VQVDSETLTAVGNNTVTPGETAYLFGDGTHGELTVREWGDFLGTLGDEICCRISPTVERKLI
jgi:alanine racemase